MAKRPVTYKHADKLGRDGQACLDFARLVWNGLPSNKAREAIRDGWCSAGSRTCESVHGSTMKMLKRSGLVDGQRWSFASLTPLGLLVREVGTRTAVES